MGLFDLFKSKDTKSKAAKRNFFNIEVADIVSYDDKDYIVKQVYEYNEHGYRWMDYHLVDGEDEIWLGVDDDDGIELAIYTEIDMEINGFPQTITHEGEAYKLEEKGFARVTNKSDYTDTKFVEVEYADYENSSGKKYLSLERWGNEYEASIGFSIKEYNIKILPHA